jgi:hypothetical protein
MEAQNAKSSMTRPARYGALLLTEETDFIEVSF